MRTSGIWIESLNSICKGNAFMELNEVFISGEEGCHTYRIPVVVATKQGTLLILMARFTLEWLTDGGDRLQ